MRACVCVCVVCCVCVFCVHFCFVGSMKLVSAETLKRLKLNDFFFLFLLHTSHKLQIVSESALYTQQADTRGSHFTAKRERKKNEYIDLSFGSVRYKVSCISMSVYYDGPSPFIQLHFPPCPLHSK